MPLLNGCCCFARLRNGSRASAIFTFICGVINIAINAWLLEETHGLYEELEEHEQYIFLMPGISVFLYIELAVNLGYLAVSLCLWIGLNQGYEGTRLVRAWLYGMTIFRFYEILLGIYVLAWLGGHRIADIVYVVPESIVMVIYWVLTCFILIFGLLCVYSYLQELTEEIHGKERKARYYNMLANIRQAAGPKGGITPGARSYYSSRMMLASSHGSLAHPHHPQSHPSVSSYGQHPSVSSYPGQHPSVSSYPGHPYPQHPSASSYHPQPQPHHSVSSYQQQQHPSTSSYHSAGPLPHKY